MNKIWISEDTSKDLIIAWANDVIYHGNPKAELVQDYVLNINQNQIPNDLVGIPIAYIKTIHLSESKDYIELLFGRESTEHLIVKNPIRKQEIFDYFKGNLSNFTYKVAQQTVFQAAKKPLIALLVVSLLFVYTLSIATEIEAGAVYEMHGNGLSLAALVLILALLGVQKVIFIFAIPICIALIAAFKKAQHLPVIHTLVRHK